MTEGFKSWALLELMGHRRLYGLVEEVDLFGAKMCRIDTLLAHDAPEPGPTQIYGAPAIYCITPMSEDEVRERMRPRYGQRALEHDDEPDDDEPEPDHDYPEPEPDSDRGIPF